VRGAWIVYRRELGGLFLRPLAWVLLFLAVLYHGAVFALAVLPLTRGDVSDAMMFALGGARPYWYVMILLPPLITMRMVSEEARSGMLEYLLTAPVSDAAVVVGKLGAATTFMALFWSSVTVYGATLDWLGTVPPGGVEWGPVGTGLLGAILASGFFCAVGLAVSSATETPLVAGFLSLLVNIFLIQVFPLIGSIGRLAQDHWLREVLAHFDVVAQVQGSFMLGVLDTRGITFFLVWTGFFVFLATRFLEMRRWR
jgi:ABC-2 type transport system permease protein